MLSLHSRLKCYGTISLNSSMQNRNVIQCLDSEVPKWPVPSSNSECYLIKLIMFFFSFSFLFSTYTWLIQGHTRLFTSCCFPAYIKAWHIHNVFLQCICTYFYTMHLQWLRFKIYSSVKKKLKKKIKLRKRLSSHLCWFCDTWGYSEF